MTDRRTVEFRVEGRVQGVAYRAFTKSLAVAQGVAGWVRNERDGSVIGVLAGPPERVEALLAELRRGPPGGRVDRVDLAETEDGPVDGFEIRR